MYDFLDEGIRYDDLNIYQKHKADWLEESKKYSKSTRRSYWINLNTKVNYLEVDKKKELYKWDKEEIIQLIKTAPTTKGSTKSILFSVVSMYIAWAYKKGFNFTGNPCDSIDTSKIFTVNELAFRESYIELQKFYDFIFDLNCTDVDRAMLTLLRYGVDVDDVGKVKWEDIDAEGKTLRVNHIDEDNEEKNSILELPIDHWFMMIIEKAKACEYRPRQMKTNDKESKKEPQIVSYVDYGYIVKAPEFVEWNSMDGATVYNRVSVISKANGIQRISVPDLNDSRKYDLLFNIVDKTDNVRTQDIEDVLKMMEGYISTSRVVSLRNSFEILSGYPVERKRVRGVRSPRKKKEKFELVEV